MTISLVQQTSGSSSSAASVVTHLASSMTTGNTLLQSFCLPAGETVQSVNGGLGARWIRASNASSSVGAVELWMARGVHGGSGSVTAVFSGASVDCNLSEWSGILYTNPIDQWSQTFGNGDEVTPQTVSPRQSGDLIIGVGRAGASVGSSSGGYTSLTMSGTGNAAAYAVLSGSIASQLTWETSSPSPPSPTSYSLSGAEPEGICSGPGSKLWVADANGSVWTITTSGTATPFIGLASSTPKAICEGPDGNLWVTDPNNSAVWKVPPVSGVPTQYILSGAAGMLSICVGPDNNLWVTDTASTAGVWRVTTGGSSTKFNLPGGTPSGVCAGPDGNLWLSDGSGVVWSVTTAGVPTSHALSGSPDTTWICAGPDGNLWASDVSAAVWKITTAGSGTKYTLTGANAIAICAGADGNLYVADLNNAVWSVTVTGTPTKTSLSGSTDPFAICSGPDNNIWVAAFVSAVWKITLAVGPTTTWCALECSFLAGGIEGVNPLLQFPETLVQISTTSNYLAPLEGTGIWTDISSYVRSATLGPLGKQHLLDRIAATQATITVNNRIDAAFNPWNTGSFLYANGAGLKPQNPIRCVAAWNGECYDIFYGYAQSFTPQITDVLNVDLEIAAIDLLQILSLAYLSDDNYAQLIESDGGVNLAAYYRLGDMPGSFRVLDSSGNGQTGSIISGQGTPAFGAVGPFLADSSTALDLTGGNNVPGGGFNTVDRSTEPPTAHAPLASASVSWTFECWLQWTDTGPVPGATVPNSILFHTTGGLESTELQIGYTDFALGANGFGAYVNTIMQINSAGVTQCVVHYPSINFFDGLWHHVVVISQSSGPTGTIYLDGVVQNAIGPWIFHAPTTITIGTTPTGGGGLIANIEDLKAESFPGFMSDVALYNTALTAQQVENHYQVGTWFQQQEFGASVGGPSVGRLNKVLEVVGLNPSTILNVPYPFRTLLYNETESLVQTSALNYVQTTSQSEPGIIYQAPNGQINAYSRQYQYLNPTSVTSQGVIADNTSTVFHYDGPSLQIVQDDVDVWSDVQVQSGIPESNLALQQEIGQLQEVGPVQSHNAAVSASVYGLRTLQGLTALQMANNSDALAIAQYYGSVFNFPIPRVMQIQLNSEGSGGANIPMMLGRNLWDRLTIEYTGQSQGPMFQQDSLIEGITHTIQYDGGPTWDTVFAMSPYEILLTPFIFGNSAQSQLAGAASVTGSGTSWTIHPPGTAYLSGTISLTVSAGVTTIPYNATASQVQTALAALVPSTTCTGGPIQTTNVVVTFGSSQSSFSVYFSPSQVLTL